MNFLQIVVNGGDNHIWITDSERFFFFNKFHLTPQWHGTGFLGGGYASKGTPQSCLPAFA